MKFVGYIDGEKPDAIFVGVKLDDPRLRSSFVSPVVNVYSWRY